MACRCRHDHIPVGVCIGRRNSFAVWPCARGPIPVPGLVDRSASSTSFVVRRPTRALPSSRDGHKTAQKISFSCVTTQASVCALVWRLSSAVRHRLYVAAGVCARTWRARDDAPLVRAGVAGVWRLAIGAPVEDNSDPGSSAGCVAWAEIGADSPCASNSVRGAFWRAALALPGLHSPKDVVLFPREVLLPGDRSGRNANSSLGTLPVFGVIKARNTGDNFPTRSPTPATSCHPQNPKRAGDFKVDHHSILGIPGFVKGRPTAK